MEKSERELQDELNQANAAYEGFVKDFKWNESEAGRQEFRVCCNAVSAAETALALVRGQEAAELLDWPLRWDIGAPLPHVVASEHRVVLIYATPDTPEDWDGTWVEVRNPAEGRAEKLAIVQFTGCYGHRLGGPNDEVAEGHPLHGKGLRWYRAHVVRNSMWLAQEEATNSVHDYYNPSAWRSYVHYLLCFHDTVFECLAKAYEIEAVEASFADALKIASERVLG